ncbi:MAG: ATP-binding cassette domain-containing protein [Candidatus Hydrogenedentes bacterium]|nr:ATP-binding cassette domain-containing protein [Candidatus Hydrogenedentota bacterium]MBI3117541.1 ATP-binding cassette domain-containing protein [Candidatus Hydrogenedentota bacterium]
MIEAKGLSMRYGPVRALDDVSFQVRQGEIVGLLGPNGAGKSTTMKILTTYLYPTAGTALVGGIDVLKDPLKARRIIGYLPEILPLYQDMEVREYLDFVGRARGLRGATLRERMNSVVAACGLEPMFRKVVRELSKGYKQRTALAQALIHDPDVIILDEPTSGLDPHQILGIRELISHLAEDKTVILSTHILQEVEATADRIVIINQGKIVGDGTIEELRDRAKDMERMQVAVEGNREEIRKHLSTVSGVQDVQFMEEKDGCVSFILYSRPGNGLWREVNRVAQAQRWPVRHLGEKPLTLEETFLRLTEKAAQRAD